jgi:pimeloyl-ACP methyl ester carboxylesterase
MVHYRHMDVTGITIAYREAGRRAARTIVLLHGFPTSSHMYRELIPALADDYHVIAPDYPGFGYSDSPERETFAYTFDALADVVRCLLETLGVDRFSVFVQDYGAPVGFRLASAQPQHIEAVISQNGNAYEEGLTPAWEPIPRHWQQPLPEPTGERKALVTRTPMALEIDHRDLTNRVSRSHVCDERPIAADMGDVRKPSGRASRRRLPMKQEATR